MGLTDYVNANDAGANQQRQGRAVKDKGKQARFGGASRSKNNTLSSSLPFNKDLPPATTMLQPLQESNKGSVRYGRGLQQGVWRRRRCCRCWCAAPQAQDKGSKRRYRQLFRRRQSGRSCPRKALVGGWVGGCRRAPVVTCLTRGIGGFRGFRLS